MVILSLVNYKERPNTHAYQQHCVRVIVYFVVTVNELAILFGTWIPDAWVSSAKLSSIFH